MLSAPVLRRLLPTSFFCKRLCLSMIWLFSNSPMGSLPNETLQQQSKAIDEWSGSEGLLGEIISPVLLITGTEDYLVPCQNSQFMQEKIPNAELDLIENGGHGLMFQYPDLFCEKVMGFLAK